MCTKFARTFISAMIFTMLIAPVYAQEEKRESRFSHKGLKGSIGSASFHMISERGLEEGDGGVLSIGYGFSDRFSLWLSLLGSEHSLIQAGGLQTDFGALELNIQHKFEIESRWQPYGKVGVGLYGLEEATSNVTLIGTGLNLGIGIDYFFSKHFGVGAEFMVKKLDYVKQSVETDGGDLVSDLNPNLNGDTVGFMITLMIQ